MRPTLARAFKPLLRIRLAMGSLTHHIRRQGLKVKDFRVSRSPVNFSPLESAAIAECTVILNLIAQKFNVMNVVVLAISVKIAAIVIIKTKTTDKL